MTRLALAVGARVELGERVFDVLEGLVELAREGVDLTALGGDLTRIGEVLVEVEALSGSLSETLQDIEDALAKFDAGTYGECESCGKPIPEARLEAMPAARVCIDCASLRR